MNGGLDGHTMQDRSLIGSMHRRNKHSQGIYIGVKVWHFQETRNPQDNKEEPSDHSALKKKKQI